MKNKFLSLCTFIVCLGFVIATLYPRTSFAETCEQWVAKVVSVQGTVEATNNILLFLFLKRNDECKRGSVGIPAFC